MITSTGLPHQPLPVLKDVGDGVDVLKEILELLQMILEFFLLFLG